MALIIQFLPSIAITGMNVIVPLIFEALVQKEDYSAEFEIKITIARYSLRRQEILLILCVCVCAFTISLPNVLCCHQNQRGKL